MPCHWIRFRDKDGVEHVAHVKTAPQRKRKCAFCGDPVVEALCDYPRANGKTCDKAICFRHRVHVGADFDYCLDHDLTKPMPTAPAAIPVQGGLF